MKKYISSHDSDILQNLSNNDLDPEKLSASALDNVCSRLETQTSRSLFLAQIYNFFTGMFISSIANDVKADQDINSSTCAQIIARIVIIKLYAGGHDPKIRCSAKEVRNYYDSVVADSSYFDMEKDAPAMESACQLASVIDETVLPAMEAFRSSIHQQGKSILNAIADTDAIKESFSGLSGSDLDQFEAAVEKSIRAAAGIYGIHIK